MMHEPDKLHALGRQCTLAVIGLTLMCIPLVPASVDALGEYLFCYGCPTDTVLLECPGPVMRKAPTFASNPPGFAAYPFDEQCPVALQKGQYHNGVIHLYFEGRWNPSETRQDRPNAVETLFIEDYEQFFPNRQMKGPGERRIFVYWTARCTKDPWLQGGTCQRLGGYVPSDVREAFPSQIEDKPFPLTKDALSAKLKQQLITQYQAANQSGSARMTDQQRIRSMVTQPTQSPIVKQSPPTQAMLLQPPPSQMITQSQAAQAMTVQPQSPVQPNTSVSSLSRAGVFARGVDEKEGEAAVSVSEGPETTEMAVLEEGTSEIAEAVAVRLDSPFHTTGTKGNPVELKPGVYEIGTIMDLQLGLAQEGQWTVLLDADRDRHSFQINQTFAAVIPGPSGDLHLLYLTLDGRRFEVVGYPAAAPGRNTSAAAPLSDKAINNVVASASVKSRSVSSPPCKPNSAETGPRWIPVPCTVLTAPP